MGIDKNKTRRLMFAAEYLVDFNGSAAAERAGVPKKGAKVQACRWLKFPDVIAEMDRLKAAQLERAGIKTERILRELANIGLSNLDDFIVRPETKTAVVGGEKIDLEPEPVWIDISKATREQMAAVMEIQTETWTEGKGDNATKHTRTRVKLYPKTPALELIGRHLKAWDDGKGGGSETNITLIVDM